MILLQDLGALIIIEVPEGNPGIPQVVPQHILIDHLPTHWPQATFGMGDEGDLRAIDCVGVLVVNRAYVVIVGSKGSQTVKDLLAELGSVSGACDIPVDGGSDCATGTE